MPSSIIGGKLPTGKFKEVSLDASGRLECSANEVETLLGTTNTTLTDGSQKTAY